MAAANQERNMARVGTAIYAIAILLIIFLVSWSKPFPLPEEEGVLVNLGFTDVGMGDNIPEYKKNEISNTPTAASASQSSQEEVLSSEVEESVAINEHKNDSKKVVNETKNNKTTEEVKTEVKQSVNNNAMFSSNDNKNNQANQGIKAGNGDMGQKNGSNNSNVYTGKSTGLGDDGIGYDLSGRSMTRKPAINDKSNKTGTVKIKIKVDNSGNVVEAKFTQQGSTTNDPYLIQLSESAAKQARFNASSNSPEFQIGTITFVYKVQ